MKNEESTKILVGYTRSVFQDSERYLRTKVDLIEGETILVLDEYNSSFISYELQPGVYSFKDLSEFLFNILQPEFLGFNKSIDFEIDNINMKTELIVRSGIINITFHEKSFLVLS